MSTYVLRPFSLSFAQDSRLNPTCTQTRAHTQAIPRSLTATTTQTSAERLARLRALRHAWQTLTWTGCVTVPMPGPCCAYELVGGVFYKTQPTVRRGRGPLGQGQGQGRFGVGGGGMVEGWPGAVHIAGAGPGTDDGDPESAHVHGSRSMSATWLPGAARERERHGQGLWRTEVRDDLGIPTRDFAMDTSQDLLVLFKGGEDPGLYVSLLFFPLCPILTPTPTIARWWSSFLACSSCTFGPCRRIRCIQRRECRCCARRCCTPSRACLYRSSMTSWGSCTASTPRDPASRYGTGRRDNWWWYGVSSFVIIRPMVDGPCDRIGLAITSRLALGTFRSSTVVHCS